MDWFEGGVTILEKIVKKSKKSKAALIVLSQTGDLVLRAGSTKNFDFTSMGALASALAGVQAQLDAITKIKSKRIIFSDTAKEYWVEPYKGWLVIGLVLSQKTNLKDLYKHLSLKRAPKLESQTSYEPLDGLSEAGVDAALI